jgi:hypothetical protein
VLKGDFEGEDRDEDEEDELFSLSVITLREDTRL